MWGLLRKSACPFGQVETKMYLPESHFFKNSLAGASWQVLMSDHDGIGTNKTVQYFKGA